MLFNISNFAFADGPNISAEAAILIDANTGTILFEKNSDKSMYPASTTKIMTAILTLEHGNLNDEIVVDDKTPYEINGSHIALEPGEIMSLNDLLHALLIESANDSAVVIAKHISGSVEEFAKLMNSKAKEIGAKNTNFRNPNGLPDKEHTTTAYDLAVIAKYALENKQFKEIVSNYKYTIEPTNKKDIPRYLKSSNRLLYSNEKINVDGKSVSIMYEGADGVKTGYTVDAQQCLVSTASRGDQRFIAVVLRAVGRDVYVDTHKLLNYGFENFSTQQLAIENEFIKNIEVDLGERTYATAIIGQPLFTILSKGREDDIQKKVTIPDNITAPITKDQVLGKIDYTLDGNIIGTVDIISAVDVAKKPFYTLWDLESDNFILKKWWIWLIVVLFSWRIYIGFRRLARKKRRSNAFTINNSRRFL